MAPSLHVRSFTLRRPTWSTDLNGQQQWSLQRKVKNKRKNDHINNVSMCWYYKCITGCVDFTKINISAHLPTKQHPFPHERYSTVIYVSYCLRSYIVFFSAEQKIKDIILPSIFFSRCPVTAERRGMKSGGCIERCACEPIELSLTAFTRRMKQKWRRNCFSIRFSKRNAIAMSVTSCKLCNPKCY